MDVGPAELIVICAVILLLFGAKKLPELARGLGQAKHEFEAAARHSTDDTTDHDGGASDAT